MANFRENRRGAMRSRHPLISTRASRGVRGGSPGGVWGRAPVNGGAHFRLECPFCGKICRIPRRNFELAGRGGDAILSFLWTTFDSNLDPFLDQIESENGPKMIKSAARFLTKMESNFRKIEPQKTCSLEFPDVTLEIF